MLRLGLTYHLRDEPGGHQFFVNDLNRLLAGGRAAASYGGAAPDGASRPENQLERFRPKLAFIRLGTSALAEELG